MSSLSERIWYGTAQQPHETALDWRRPLMVAGVLVGLVLVRLSLPFSPHPSMRVYEQVVWALFHQENWGRQALVASLEYPPLPLVGLLVLSPFAKWSFTDPSRLLVAISQVWTLTYLVRLADLYHSRRLRYVLGGLLFVVLVAGPSAAETNPFWVEVVVLASVLYHVCRWETSKSLRDLVVVALNCGLLVFCGFVGIVFCLVILLTMWLRGDPKVLRQEGGTTLMLLPTLYALLLYPLFNWLVMGDMWFWVKQFLGSFNEQRFLRNFVDLGNVELQLLLILVAVMVVAMLVPKLPLYVRTACVLATGAGVCAILRNGTDIYLGGEFLMTGFVEVPLLLFFLYYDDSEVKRVPYVMATMGVCILFIAACVQFRGTAKAGEQFAVNPRPPDAAELLDLVDKYWLKSRILVYDLRTASLYVSEHPDRFSAQLDYRENELKAMIRKEQFHLLVPPNNGKYYSRAGGAMASIHEQSRSWLLLEKEWPGGWQLWRCIRPLPNPQ